MTLVHYIIKPCEFEPTLSLFCVYLLQVVMLCCSLSEKNLSDAARRLMNADLHGAVIHVTRSKCPSLIGTSGILLQEKRNSFVLVTEENRLKSNF